MVLRYSKKIEKALQNQPVTIDDLADLIGKNKKAEKTILKSINQSAIKLEPIRISYDILLSISLAFMIIIETLSSQLIQNYLSLVIILILPYFWTNHLLIQLKINEKLTTGLVVAELMIIGLIIGNIGMLNRQTISICLFISVLAKYGLVKIISHSKSVKLG